MSVDGVLYLHRGQNDSVDLQAPLRAGCSDDELETLVREATLRKPLRHELEERPAQVMRFMSSTGG